MNLLKQIANDETNQPIAEIVYAGLGDTRRLQFVAVKETLPDHMKLYATPQQDVLNAKRLKHIYLHHVQPEPAIYDYDMWLLSLDAAILATKIQS
jgi:hypothetical protein